MNVLVTGRGTSGSWKIRGEQLGAAIGAKVVPQASREEIKAADLVVVVKRARPDLLDRLKGARVVYDVVDAWPQPDGNEWSHREALDWLDGQIAAVRPVAIVAATQAMAFDCRSFGVPVLALPHHGRPGIEANPIRAKIERVGYEGGVKYLGRWMKFLPFECERRGWEFVVNPPRLADLDIVVALRDSRGYPARNWKSNVKLANAQASGTPCIVNYEQGYSETASGAEQWADTQVDVKIAFDRLTPQAIRRDVSEKLRAAAPRIEDLADKYLAWLHEQSRS